MRQLRVLLVLLAALASTRIATCAQEDASVKALIEKITSENIDVRYAARSEAAGLGAPAVAALARLLDASRVTATGAGDVERLRREISLTAHAALERIVHNAGRPGADAERAAVAAELAKALTPETTPKAKREIIFLVAFIGGDPEVPAVARWLDDADRTVSETARIALERIPGKTSTQALIEAAKRQTDDKKPDLLIAAGRKGDPSATPALLEFSKGAQGAVRVAALKGLACLGALEAVPVFADLLKSRDLPERALLYGEFLRLADNISLAGKREEAKAIYALALKEAPLDHQRERALFQLSAGAGGLDTLLAGLSDPSDRVRRLALARLEGLKGAEVLATLRKAYEAATPEAQPSLLRILAEKDRAASRTLIEEAVKSSQPELKLVALDVEGRLEMPELEPMYVKVAESGSAQAKPVAVKAILLLAKRSLDAGEREKALGMFGRALELAATPEQRIAALQGLIAVGDPKVLDQVAGLLKDSTLASEAARGFVALAGKLGATGDKDRAEGYLMQIVTGEFPKDLRSQAAEELKKMGRDPQLGVRNQGFIVSWWVLTPIQDPDGKALETEYFPEKVIDLINEQRIGPRKFRWQKLTEVSLDGRINLLTSFRRSDKVITYAYTEIEAPAEQEALFKMGSDDGMACWLNGRRVHIANVARGLTVDQDVIAARLVAGKNKVLLKIANQGGDWGFAFRVTDREGKPLVLRQPE